ncbi:vWA domain-containing protein [Sediminispirochaeta smaragdinae]|uniref:vWA domain-containing protein n=1 Tax=Sediminispirochaeta smaragdinae TaxID=55206 RepID=UPI000300C358|nr:vWA domain-containing protein [Sediminispirochaeta smaragdinae]
MKKRSDGRRRVLLPVAIFLLFIFSGSGALTAQSVDAVVLIDTSESMFSYFDATRDYLIHRILTEELKIGDSFHLLSFSDRPEYEISRKLKGVEEIKDVIARLMLLQPLGHYTDLVAACKELYDYTSDLPLETQKEIFILTDGIHDPPPGSPYPVSSRNGEDVSDIAASMRRNGWKVHIIQFPIVASDASMQSDLSGDLALASDDNDNAASSPGTVSSDNKMDVRPEATQEEAVAPGSDSGTDRTDQGPEPGNNLLPTISDKLGVEAVPYSPEGEGFAYRATGQLEIVFPRTLGKIGEEFVLPLDIRNHLEGPAAVKINDLLINGTPSLEKPVSLGLNPGAKRRVKLNLTLPSSVSEGEGTIDVELRLGDAGRAFPRSSTISVRVVRGEGIVGGGTPFRMILFFLVVIVVLVPVILLIRRASGNKEDNKESRVSKEIYSETKERERVSSVSPNIPKIEKHAAALPAFTNTPVSRDLPQSRQTERMHEAVDSLQAYQRQERPLPEFYRTTTTTGETNLPPKLRSTGTVSLSASARHDSGLYTIKEIVSARAQGKIAVEMVVRDQNRLIGRRNIKWMKDGETLKIGGAASSPFIIFLYPVPSSIGTLTRQGEQFFFTPESSDRFLGFGDGDMLKSECIDMPITFAVNNEVSIEFRFHRWISPLESLNRMLHMIDEPGLPK